MSQPAAFRSVGNAVGDAPNRYAPPFGPLGVKWARVDWFAPHVNEGYGHIAGDGDVFADMVAQDNTVLPLVDM
jgi:hypothetical protein